MKYIFKLIYSKNKQDVNDDGWIVMMSVKKRRTLLYKS
jgi:hypothetical protein